MTAAAAPAAAQDNNAPTVDNPIPDQTIEAGVEWTYVVPANTFSDPDGDTLTYLSDGARPLPSGITFDPATRTFSGTPISADIGRRELGVNATDPDGDHATDLFLLTITPRLPAVTTGDVLLTNLDQAATSSSSASLLNQSAAQLFTTGDHAAGYTLGSVEVAFVNSPVNASDLAFSLWSVDSSGTDPLPKAKVADLTLSGSVTLISTTAFTAPAGTTLVANTSYAVVGTYTGTDSAGDLRVTTEDQSTSSFGFTMLHRASLASGGSWTKTLGTYMLMRVIGTEKGDTNAAPTLDNPLADQEAIAGRAFTYQFPDDAFSDPDGDTLTYSTSNLPTWLSFDAATRTFSGTPPGSLLLVPFDVRVTATDPGGLFAQDDFDVTLFVDVPELTSGDGDVLVTNLDQAASDTNQIFTHGIAQAFTTGSHAAGYTLGSIEIAFKAFDSSSTEIEKLSASLWSTTTDSFGNVRPNMNVQALTLAGTITDTGTTRFTAPAGTTLDADTSYAVVFTYSGSDPTTFTARITESKSETSSFGFNLEDNKVFGTSGTATISNAPLMMRVIGAEKTAVTESCAAPDFGTRRQIWTGTVTVGPYQSSGVTLAYGFLDSSATDAGTGQVGALDDTDFDIGPNGYTIDTAAVYEIGAQDGDLFFSLTSDLTAAEVDALQLHVCDTEHNFGDAIHHGSTNSYQWEPAPGLDWSGQSTRTLYLSLPANNAAGGAPTISSSGAAYVGDVLTADPGGITDDDGKPSSFEYQWVREDADGTNPQDIAGETSSTYTLAAADVGKRVRVRVEFIDLLGGEEAVSSAPWPATGTVTNLPTVTNCPAPDYGTRRRIWSAVLTPAQTGTMTHTWGYADATSKGSLSPRSFSIGPTSFTITALTARNDTRLSILLGIGLTAAQQNALRLHVCDTAFDFSDDADTASSALIQITTSDIDWTDGAARNVHLSLPANNAAVGTPTISSSGAAFVGDVLTADGSVITDADGLPSALEYQWVREDADGTNPEDIAGETSSTYTLAAADVGKKVRVRVEFVDLLGGEESVESAAWPATGTVTGLPTITIAADRTQAPAFVGLITYTLTREGDTANQLKVNVVFTGPSGHDWGLTSGATREVTFNAGSATATLERRLTTGFFGIGFGNSATVSGVLTASIGMVSGHDLTGYDTTDTAEVQVDVPPTGENQFRVRFTQTAYEFVEGGGPYTITIEAAARSTDVTLPIYDFRVGVISRAGTAKAVDDYTVPATVSTFRSSDCASNADSLVVCTKTVTITIVDDDVVEPPENFVLRLEEAPGFNRVVQFVKPDDTLASAADYPATIRDDDNTAPTASDKTVMTDEDTAYAFAAADFNFEDTDTGDTLASVKITSLETAGDLELDGVDVTANQEIAKADIDADKLTFTPAANAHGAGYATFMFRVSDGNSESASAYTMTVDVDAVNDAPTSDDETVMTEEDTPYAFKLADFAFADVDAGDALDSVTVVTLPGAGKGELKLDGAPVTQNQAFPQTAVVGGQFTYTPPANANGDAFASFTFRVSDGEDESVAAYTMTVDVTPVEDAPVLATPIANQRAPVGEPFSFTIPAGAFEDGDGDLLNYEATLTDDNPLPAWLMFDDTTLTFEGTPGSGDAGTLTVKVKVSDGDEEASDTFDIVVAAQTGTACPAPNFGTRRQIWTGNLTVGSFPASDGGTNYGFSFDGGALDDTTYTIGTRVRNIFALTHQLGGSSNNQLRFRTQVRDGSLTDVEIAALRLHVCNTAYDFSAATAAATNDVFLWNTSLDWSGESTRTLYLSLPANRAATGGPGVSSDGAAVSGDTLTADPAGIADPDGLPDAFTYQWLREDADGSNPAPIPGETSATYTLTNDDVGKRVRVRVGFTDQLGSAETRESGPWPSSGAVAEDPANPVRPNTPASGAPTISGPAGGDAPRVGDTLTADIGAVDDTDGLPPAAGFGYQWVREDADGSNREDIPGANGPGYTLVPEDAGKRVSVRVTFIDEGGRTETVTSAPTAAVAARAVADDALPELVADARTVTIDWGEALDPGSVPAPGDFEVRKSDLDETGREWTLLASLAEVRVVGSTVTLRLDNRLPHDAVVRVSYTPGASPVRYAGGGDAPGFAQAAAQNRTPDIEPPKVLRRDQVTVNGATLRITFSESLDPGSVPEAEGFDVNTYINVHRHESILVERVSVSGRVVRLTLARVVGGEESVSVSYGLRGGTPIRDLAGNPSWTGGRYGADNRTVEGTAADKTLTVDGDTVRVVFDAVLDAATVPGPYDFKVKGTRTSSHGYRWKKLRTETTVASIRTVAVSGSTVTLTLDNPPIDHEMTVRLSYVPGDSPLRFGDGTAVDAFSNLPVENRTAAPGSGRPVAQAQSEEEAQPAAAQQESAEAAAQPSGPPLTAALAARNAEHGGDPTVREAVSLRFSEAPAGLGSTELRARVSVTGGTLDAVEGSGAAFTVWFRPAGVGPVTVRLPAGGACGASGSICTGDGRALSGPAAVSIQGPIVVSVADAEVREAPGATLDFVVSLSRPAPAGRRLLLVGFRTQDGTAKDGEDYRGLRGRTYIRPGETSTTISIGVVDDAHDEGAETMTLTLSGPTSGRIGDGTATGTITNDDPMPQAWAARFGRTVAEQVLDAVESRMRASRAPGAEVSVAGRRMGLGPVLGDAQPSAGEDRAARAEAEREARGLADWLSDETDLEGRGAGARTVTGRELLLGSGFTLTAAPEAGGAMSLWGRSAVSRFEGREGDLALDGEVASGLVGADWAPVSGASVVGVVVGHSRGEGGYRAGSGDGTVRSTLTGVYPWGRHAFSERLSVWGSAGVGEGSLTLMPDEGGALRTDLGLVMGAVGFRAGGALAVTGDALGVRTTTARARGVEGSEADVTRVRLGVERSWALRFPGGMGLAPSVALGLRHDGGDAERGFGADIGGGVGWTDPGRGVTAELRGRGLLSHEASGLRERGVSGALSWEPGSGGRGPRLRVSQTMGGASSGGPAALLGRGTLAGLGAGEGSEARRFELELGYGVGVLGERWTATPELGLGLTDAERELRVGGRLARRGAGKLAFEAALGVSEAGREYVLGWRLARRAVGGVGGGLELAVEATRREGSGGATRHGVGLRVGSHW